MPDILVLGVLPAAPRRAALARAPAYRVVSTSPWLAAQLRQAGVPHRAAESYATTRTWEALHAAAARRLRDLHRRGGAAADEAWLDDWSHLLVEDLRDQAFWDLVARGVAARERPRRVYVQRVAPPCAAAGAVATLREALAALGLPCRRW